MARTPQLTRIRRLAHAHRLARQGGADPEEILGRWRADTLSRRQLLSGLGAASLIPLVGCGKGSSGKDTSPTDPRVVIVGGGIAGLNCCHRLAQAGVSAEVYEARDRVGGRMWTGQGLFAGGETLWTERGGEFVDSNHAEMQALVTELGLSLLDLWEDDLGALVYLGGQRYTEVQMLRKVGPLADACDAALATLDNNGEGISYLTPEGAETLDNTSAAGFLAAADLDDDVKTFADIYTSSEYGLDCSEQSAINLLFMFGGTETGADQRYKITGGNDQVPTTLAAMYEDRVHLSMALSALSQAANGTYTLSFADGTEVDADIVVLAIPFTLLREVAISVELPAAKTLAIQTLGYGTNAKLLLPVTSKTWRAAGDCGDLITDLAMQSGWDSSELQDGDFGVYTNFVSGSHGVAIGDGTDAEQGTAAFADLESAWPGTAAQAAGDAIRVWWPGDPWIKASYACYTVGQWTTVGGAEGEAVDALFFAGEHTSAEFQGYMNGGAQTGKDAAEAVLALLGKGARRARPVLAGRRFGRNPARE